MKYILPAITIMVLATGCTRGPNGLPVLKLPHRGTQQSAAVAPIQESVQKYPSGYAPGQSVTTTANSNITNHKKVLYVSKKRKTHGLKPEPYSIASGEKDPELLGPQTTIKRNLKSSPKNKIVMPVMKEKDLTSSKKSAVSSKKVSTLKKKIAEKSSIVKKSKTSTSKAVASNTKKIIKKKSLSETNSSSKKKLPTQSKKTDSPMTKAECVKMIGESKFTDYVSRFGGESGAVKRCVILKKLKG